MNLFGEFSPLFEWSENDNFCFHRERVVQNICKRAYVMNEWSQSTLPLNTTGPFAGLKLIKESIKKDTNFKNGITICLRFRMV